MIATIALGCFVLAGACAAARVGLGPTLADRIAALDVALISLMGGIVAHAADTGSTDYLIVTVVIAIVGFLATMAASTFITAHERDERS